MYNVTNHGLHHWFKCEFEKLGWMVLALHERDDLQIMLNNVQKLKSFVDESFHCTNMKHRHRKSPRKRSRK